MKGLLFALLLISFPASYAMTYHGTFSNLYLKSSTVTASPGSIVNLYLNDNDLNTSHNGIDVISTAGLLEFTIKGIPIEGPKIMKETSVNSGVFFIELSLPSTLNGKPLERGDILLVKYNDQTDRSGEPTTITKSIVLSKTLSKISTSIKNVRIGEKFLLRLYEPDWNLDSDEPETIPLSLVKFRANGIRTTLANPAFDTSTAGLRETGPNTNFFVVNLEMPREMDGKTIKIGSTVEFRFTDISTAASTSETIKTILRVGSK